MSTAEQQFCELYDALKPENTAQTEACSGFVRATRLFDLSLSYRKSRLRKNRPGNLVHRFRNLVGFPDPTVIELMRTTNEGELKTGQRP